jgi:hypothetical protein
MVVMREEKMHMARTDGKEGELHEQLAAYARAWARHNIYIGTSCTHRRLGEHAGIFSTACVDIHPQTSAPTFLAGASLPEEFRLALALMSKSLVYRFPHRHAISAQRGAMNERFLDAEALCEELHTLLPSPTSCGEILVLPIEQIYTTEELSSTVFFEKLGRFLCALPTRGRYAVELHNRKYLLPEYFDLLHERRVAHVLSDCTGMSTVLEQIQLPRVLTTNAAVLRAGPEMDTDLHLGIMETIRRCVDEGVTLYLYIHDGAEDSSAQHAIARLMELLNVDLARLSPIKNRAA